MHSEFHDELTQMFPDSPEDRRAAQANKPLNPELLETFRRRYERLYSEPSDPLQRHLLRET